MRIALILAGMMLSLAAAPQEIYRWVDKDGVVHYSDQPGAPNAELVQIARSNEYEATPSESESGDAATYDQPPAEPAYEYLIITQPTQDQVFFGADASITASVELGGTLQPDHTLAIFLDGNSVPTDGGRSALLPNPARGTHILRASVLDQNGTPLISTKEIAFHVRQPSINTPQSPQAPPPPKPQPKPKPST
jgi:hypothetical protein